MLSLRIPDVSRAIARRAERQAVRLLKWKQTKNPIAWCCESGARKER